MTTAPNPVFALGCFPVPRDHDAAAIVFRRHLQRGSKIFEATSPDGAHQSAAAALPLDAAPAEKSKQQRALLIAAAAREDRWQAGGPASSAKSAPDTPASPRARATRPAGSARPCAQKPMPTARAARVMQGLLSPPGRACPLPRRGARSARSSTPAAPGRRPERRTARPTRPAACAHAHRKAAPSSLDSAPASRRSAYTHVLPRPAHAELICAQAWFSISTGISGVCQKQFEPTAFAVYADGTPAKYNRRSGRPPARSSTCRRSRRAVRSAAHRDGPADRGASA